MKRIFAIWPNRGSGSRRFMRPLPSMMFVWQQELKEDFTPEARDAWEKALKIKPGDPLLQKALAELSLYEAKFKR